MSTSSAQGVSLPEGEGGVRGSPSLNSSPVCVNVCVAPGGGLLLSHADCCTQPTGRQVSISPSPTLPTLQRKCCGAVWHPFTSRTIVMWATLRGVRDTMEGRWTKAVVIQSHRLHLSRAASWHRLRALARRVLCSVFGTSYCLTNHPDPNFRSSQYFSPV